MKKLIRSKATRAFLSPEGSWTGDSEQARVFEGIEEALAVAREMNLQGVELYYVLAESGKTGSWDFAVPIG